MAETASKIKYHVHEDFRFPVSLLFRALWVLENHGYEKFRKYTAKIDMPVSDIERVINKNKYNTEPEFKAKINEKIKDIKDTLGVELKP